LLERNGGAAYAILQAAYLQLDCLSMLHDVAAATMRECPPVWNVLLSRQPSAVRSIIARRLAGSDWQRTTREKIWK
jgi:hypothetical protein